MTTSRDSLDGILDNLGVAYHNAYPDNVAHNEAKQAIHQWALDEVIGADEEMATKEFGLSPDDVYMPEDTIRQIRNDLRAEQRLKLKGDIDD